MNVRGGQIEFYDPLAILKRSGLPELKQAGRQALTGTAVE